MFCALRLMRDASEAKSLEREGMRLMKLGIIRLANRRRGVRLLSLGAVAGLVAAKLENAQPRFLVLRKLGKSALLHALTVVAAVLCHLPLTAVGSTPDSFTGPNDGNWTVSSNWSAGIPGSTNDVYIVGNYVNFPSEGFVYYNELFPQSVNSVNTDNAHLVIDASTSLTTTNEVIGYLSTAASSVENYGTQTVTSSLNVGETSGYALYYDAGTSNIANVNIGWTGTGVLENNQATESFGTLTIGAQPTSASSGVFELYGGTTDATQIDVGAAQNASGSVYMSAGTINTTLTPGTNQLLRVGVSGNGTFTQAGGSVTTNSLWVGDAAGSVGTYVINGSGATLSIVRVTGGSDLVIGYDAGATGMLSLQNGTLQAADYLTVGSSGAGTFNQSGGTSNIAGSLIIGQFAGSSGTALLSGGSLSNGGEIVGYLGSGNAVQTAGTDSTTNLYLAQSSGSVGSYSLNGNGTLSASTAEFIGNSGNGTFTQSAGFNTTPTFTLGYNSGGAGTYNLSGTGSLSPSGSEYVGVYGNGTFLQSGGTNAIAGSFLFLGTYANTTGYYNLGYSSGSGTLTVATGGTEIIGNSGNGTFIQSAGVNSTPSLTIGNNSGGQGSYNLSGGSLTVSSNEYVGFSGTGTFTQSGGTHTIGSTASPQSLIVGYGGPAGTYLLSNSGVLTLNGYEIVGDESAGTFNQTGGTQTIGSASSPQNLDLGFLAHSASYPGGAGTYSLSGTGSLTVTGSMYVGGTSQISGGTGVLTVSGGSMSVAGSLKIWNTAGNSVNLTGGTIAAGTLDTTGVPGNFNWSSGTLNITGSTGLAIGSTGPLGSISLGSGLALGVTNGLTIDSAGTLNVSSGTLSAGSITQSGVATFAGSNGLIVDSTTAGTTDSYSLQGGSLTVTGSEYVGDSGNGSFSQSGGVQTIGSAAAPRYLDIGYGHGSAGTYSLSGNGSLTVTASEFVGYLGNGSFNQTAGVQTIGTVGSYQYLDLGLGGTGSFGLSGAGSLSVNGGVTVGQLAAGTFNQSGGSLSSTITEVVGNYGAGTFNQNGGLQTIGTTASPANLWVGGNGGLGNYILSNGTLIVSGVEEISVGSAGTFSQSGGVNTIGSAGSPQELDIGSDSGTYLLGGGSLAVNGSVYVGGSSAGSIGIGALTASAGSMSVSGTLKIWNTAGTIVNLTGGTIAAGTLDTSGVPANFNWSSGTLDLTGPAGLTIGTGGPLTAVKLLSGSTLIAASAGTLTSSGSLSVNGGSLSMPTINQTGGSFLNTGTLTLAGTGGNSATYNLSGGTLTTGSLNVAAGGAFNWSAGTLDITNSTVTIGTGGIFGPTFAIGTQSGTQSLLTNFSLIVDAGTLNIGSMGWVSASSEIVGNSSAGTLTQNGGTNTAGFLTIGANAGSAGSYTLAGGTLNVNSSIISIGQSGNGTLNQTGGYLNFSSTGGEFSVVNENVGGTVNQSAGFAAVSVGGVGYIPSYNPAPNGGLTVDSSRGTPASYSLSGTGNLTASNETIGASGSGIFTENGGGNQISSYLLIGYQSGAGTYTLNGGQLSSGAAEVVGVNGNGTFNQSGGSNNMNGSGPGINVATPYALCLGYNSGSSGTYNLSGSGYLTSQSEYIGMSGNGTFSQSSGTNYLLGTLTIGQSGGGTGYYALGGGTLEAGSVKINAGGSLIKSGGVLQSSGGIAVSGGLLAGTGSISAPVSISSGGTISGGDGVSITGTLSTGTQTWNSGGSFLAKVNSGSVFGTIASPHAGDATSDELIMSGLTVGSTSTSPFSIQLNSLGATVFAAGAQLLLAQVSGASQGTINNILNDLTLNTSGLYVANGDHIALAEVYSGGNDDLVAETVSNTEPAPEPASFLLFGAVLSPILLARRPRRGPLFI
jgi:fibronectin-binding autotransporter adhesin